MITKDMTINAVTSELGLRLKTARLNANLTQKQLAAQAGISIKAVVNAEQGKSTLESFVAIMLTLQLTEQLNAFLPVQPLSPIQLANAQANTRKRASGKNSVQTKSKSTW